MAVVIIGLSKQKPNKTRLFDGIIETNPSYISPHLIGSNIPLPIVKSASKNLNGLPRAVMGTKPADNGNYIFTDEGKTEFLKKEPNAEPLLRPYTGVEEFLKGEIRWILKLNDADPKLLDNLPHVQKRIKLVREFRAESKADTTKVLDPKLFSYNMFPTTPFLLLLSTTLESREYVPFGYMSPPVIPSNASNIIQDCPIDVFGLLTSKMHMVWLRAVYGRLETRLRYSIDMVYKTFPVPDDYTSLKPLAQNILDIREKYPNVSPKILYDKTTMPSDLRKAHQKLDKAVEKLYRKEPFKSDDDRIQFLFVQYQKMIEKPKPKFDKFVK